MKSVVNKKTDEKTRGRHKDRGLLPGEISWRVLLFLLLNLSIDAVKLKNLVLKNGDIFDPSDKSNAGLD